MSSLFSVNAKKEIHVPGENSGVDEVANRQVGERRRDETTRLSQNLDKGHHS